jgi:hypothetical protein
VLDGSSSIAASRLSDTPNRDTVVQFKDSNGERVTEYEYRPVGLSTSTKSSQNKRMH